MWSLTEVVRLLYQGEGCELTAWPCGKGPGAFQGDDGGGRGEAWWTAHRHSDLSCDVCSWVPVVR